MSKNTKRIIITVLLAVLACGAFAMFAVFVSSNYFITSAIKVFLFLSIPIVYFLLINKKMPAKFLSMPTKKPMLISVLLAAITLVFIVVGFLALQSYFDKETILAKILDNNISAKTYPIVFVYIVFINAFVEEFFFRGFLFANLLQMSSAAFAHILSAVMFSVYHITIVIGAIDIPLLILMLVGLFAAGIFFNQATQKSGNIWCGLIIHVGANIALNSIIAYYFYFV